DRYDSAIYKKRLKKNNVQLCSVLERIDDSPESIMMESVLEGMAEYYSRNLGREVMKGMKETALQCKHTGGCPPLGYDVGEDKKLVINQHEAEAVKAIFEMFAEGYGYSAIADYLNKHGYTTKRGRIFGKNSLYEILNNEKYTGVFVFNRAAAKADSKRNNHAYNEFYSANLARESMKGMKENALQCLHNGGSPGLGYDVDDTQHIVINEEEAKIVVMIYSMYLNGYSCKVIAEMLNEEGYITKAGNSFKTYSVYGILLNEKYTGVYIFNRAESKGYDHKRNSHKSKPPEEIIRVEGGIPAIISKEVWEAVQKKRMSKSGKLQTSAPMYLLSGKIICGVCGSKMYGSIRYRYSAEPYYMYSCHTKKVSCSNPKEIEKESLENYVISLIQKHCGLDDIFFEMPHDAPPFRYKLQGYIHSVTVNPKTITVRIIVEGEVRTFRHGRKTFKTPKQRCFK
ncbi:recombinase family protein, partial [Ruminococcus flavefaciens]|uniref:recombinase family protein n=1 Tax=Ruminococcus flavefaciens TaxID=1265 RepID=UPI0026F0FF6F